MRGRNKVLNLREKIEYQHLLMLKETSISPLKIPKPQLTLSPSHLPHKFIFMIRDRKNPRKSNSEGNVPNPRVTQKQSEKTITTFLSHTIFKPICKVLLFDSKKGDPSPPRTQILKTPNSPFHNK